MNGTTTSECMKQLVVYLCSSEDRTGAEVGLERPRQDCLDLCHRPGYLELLERVKLSPSRIVA